MNLRKGKNNSWRWFMTCSSQGATASNQECRDPPKPVTSKTRKLGIPMVMDRVVGISMHRVLEECFDPDFTESNFSFRWGWSQTKTSFDTTKAHRVLIKMNRWQSVMRRPVRLVMNQEWLRVHWLVFLHDYTRVCSWVWWTRLLIEERYTWPVSAVL